MDAEQMLSVLLNMTKKQSDTTETLLTALAAQIQDMSAATEANRLAASSVNLSEALVGRAAKDASADMQRAARRWVLRSRRLLLACQKRPWLRWIWWRNCLLTVNRGYGRRRRG
jgi:hypothetical protein